MSELTNYDKFIQQALKYGFSLFGTPKTGQTISYRTGDDGNLQKGYPKTGARFTDNDDGTITDNATGLMWVKDPEAIGGIWESAGEPVSVVWDDAIDNCNALDYANFSDWRLPNSHELYSIIAPNKADPSIEETYFPNTVSTWYWASTTGGRFDVNKTKVDFNIGSVAEANKTALNYVRPVRLGIPSD